MWLQWQPALVIAGCLAVFGWGSRRVIDGPVVPLATFAREAALVFSLYALWRYAGTIAVMHVDHALDRGKWLWDIERALHLPNEVTMQGWVLARPDVVRAANVYYAVVHVPAMIVFLLWLFVRQRDYYWRWRTTLAVSTLACLAIQLIPVAPPRMFPSLGFVDTGLVYKQSVYSALGGMAPDQLSAMPSVHVAWAVLIGVAVIQASRSRWRFLVLAHPILTIFVVTVTANHWLLDGVVGVGLVALAYALDRGIRATWARLRPLPSIGHERVPSLTPSTPASH